MSYLKKFVLPIPLFFGMSYGLPIPKGIPIPKELKDTMEKLTTEQKGQQEKQVNATRQSCESMAYNSPKASLAEKAGKDILKGAAAGAIIGATVSEDRAKGAVVGGIAGALAATTYKMATTSHLQRESYESTAKRLGYAGGNFLKAEVVVPKSEVKEGEYAEMVLRVSLLTEKRLGTEPVSITAYLSSGNTKIPIGTEEYYVELGTTPLVYQFPICSEIKPGEYTIVFEVVGVGSHASAKGSFRVIR
ncbi:MAG: glycine zipper 2TM domain-containing protein [Aquificaceae bacterium]|nr:glycine zipper 2TM domain-containing protein [Aquificaceae bacterium]